IERPPADQGFAPETYDLIVAANVLHATSNLDVSLAHARSLLAPGGLLLAYESTRNPRWLDITTGLIEGWQRFDDGWRDDHPLITAARWSEALLASGFADVLALPAAGAATAVFGQAVLIARAPGEPEANVASGAAWHEPGQPGRDGGEPSGVAVPSAGVLAAALAGALPVERGELLIGFVRQAIAHVLRITDADRLQRDQPLLDIGFDSLMAVELRNVLRTGLALQRKLPATLVFDHPNIAAIAAYLDRLLADDDGQDVDVRPSAAPVVGATAVAEMSDDDVEALLLQKLAEISDA
ncbi:MAG: hypothetical protein JWM12_2805, partial [Ilumatobacteraceae bacterium]|nr:hypothetical protein [Ilumatobacteraceae bacterium]